MGEILSDNLPNNLVIGFIALVILVIVVVGVFFILPGDNGEPDGNNGIGEISSVDLEMRGFEGGMLGGELRCRVKDAGTDEIKIRFDKIGAEDVLIFNNEENAEYAYDGDSWMKIPLDQNTSYYKMPFEEWAKKGPGTYTFSYQEFSLEVTIKEVNPDLSDTLFKPPKNASIHELEKTN
ncbi:MAG: hypothetical protein BTN85_1250 [Candidatus Methanohalarchaeum thermophilum]|uniref:Uncharacterized protein n=1 Tax=Methanohalarchaeum thermophilum TaxID=1903181 RepID=A0A1Q6DWK9_METT1|nr:MAG: hypothetical protein BTN85_1250 [Candidatus Methanohalarchaeum thermophilum]